MPAVAEYARPISESVYRIGDVESSLQPQGPEGKQLHRKADEAFRHWADRAEVLNACPEDDGIVSYVSVPPKRRFYVRTRYVFRGKGTPLPFQLEDE
jgi:hypothetical protein